MQAHPFIRSLNVIEDALNWCADTYADHMMFPEVDVRDAPLVDIPAFSPRERRVKLILQARRRVIRRHLVVFLLANPVAVMLTLSHSPPLAFLFNLLGLAIWLRCVQQVKLLTATPASPTVQLSPFPYR